MQLLHCLLRILGLWTGVKASCAFGHFYTYLYVLHIYVFLYIYTYYKARYAFEQPAMDITCPCRVCWEENYMIYFPTSCCWFPHRFVPVQGQNLEHYNISEFVSDLQHLKEQLSLCQNWDSATQWLILVVANWHTKSLWITSHFIFPTTNPLRGVWQKQWHDRKDNSHRAFFWAQGYFLPVSCFIEYQTWTMGRRCMATAWVSCAWLPRRLGVFTLVCLDSCLWSSQLSYLLARWQHASGKTTPSRSSHRLDHSFLPLHLLQLLGTSNIHLSMHALNCLGEPKEQPTPNTKQASK